MDLLRRDDGVIRAIREARPILFPPPARPGFLSGELENELEDELVAVQERERAETARRDVRRARRVP